MNLKFYLPFILTIAQLFASSASPKSLEQLIDVPEELIEKLDMPQLLKQRSQILSPKVKVIEAISPFLDCEEEVLASDVELGRKLISEGKVGCMIVAGGQASRLKCVGPKGLFPVSLIKHKSLYQIFAEKVKAAGILANAKLPLAIMTSPYTHEETVRYFEENRYFGLDPEQICFFSQEELPFLDQDGNPFLESSSKLATGPDGSGASLKKFVEQGVWSKWADRGVKYVTYIQVDNPLADPFDAQLIGFQAREQVDVAVKSIEREDPLEKIGVLAKIQDRVHVIEYSEIQPKERDARQENGKLLYLYGSISNFSFKMDFIRDVADIYYDQVPYHAAWKAAKKYNKNGEEKVMAWKFEKFIFDVFPYANKVKAILSRRENCFAPLKNAEGVDSLESVQAALLHFDRQMIQKISGQKAPEGQVIELDPQFYYPTEELLAKWKGREIEENLYLEP